MHASYLGKAFSRKELTAVIKRGKDFLKNIEADETTVDCIAVRGVSGVAVGPILAYLCKKGIAIIRKNRQDNHSGNYLESPFRVKNYIIVDDFVSSGETIYAITEIMKKKHPYSKCVGIFQYNNGAQQYFKTSKEVQEQLVEFARQYPGEQAKINDLYKNSYC